MGEGAGAEYRSEHVPTYVTLPPPVGPGNWGLNLCPQQWGGTHGGLSLAHMGRKVTIFWPKGNINVLKGPCSALEVSYTAHGGKDALLGWGGGSLEAALAPGFVCECVQVCVRVAGLGGPGMRVQQSAGPVSVHCRGWEQLDSAHAQCLCGVGAWA